jgi:hypothetical protein
MKTLNALIASFTAAAVLVTGAHAAPSIPFPSERLSPFLSANLNAIVAPFGGPGFGNAQAVIDMHESFADQMAQATPIAKPMYQAAMNVCEQIAAAMREREDALAMLSGSMSVHSGSDLGATRKVNLHDWKDWLEQQREKRENKDRQRTAAKTDAFMTSAQQVQWKQRTLQLRQIIEQSYTRERQAERAVLTQLATANPPTPPASTASTAPQPSAVAVSTAPKENTPQAQSAAAFTDKDFYYYICKHVWAWIPKGRKQESIWFDPSGTAANDNWNGYFDVTSLHSITISRGKIKANITFSPDYSSFTGVDFDGKSYVTGYIRH